MTDVTDDYVRYSKITKRELIRFFLDSKAREDDLNRRLDAADEARLRLVSQRSLDETKIHQLQTALDGAVRARTQALEDLNRAQQRMYSNGETGSKVITLTGEEFEALREDLRKLFSQEGYSAFPALSKLEDVLGAP